MPIALGHKSHLYICAQYYKYLTSSFSGEADLGQGNSDLTHSVVLKPFSTLTYFKIKTFCQDPLELGH